MDGSYLDDIYCEIYRTHLEEIGRKIYINEKLHEKSIEEEYNKFIEESIKDILLSEDEIKENVKGKFIFSTPTEAYKHAREYNKKIGKVIWGVIEWEDSYYKIVKSAGNTDPTFNKTRTLKNRKKIY